MKLKVYDFTDIVFYLDEIEYDIGAKRFNRILIYNR